MSSTFSNDSLNILLTEWEALLQGWAMDGSLSAAAQEALLLDGIPSALQDFINQWSLGDFSNLPPIVLLSSADISGAMGAYAAGTDTIYLNEDWLATATVDQVVAVLTEELGHFLDDQLNLVDTKGDEGEYFARLLRKDNLSSDIVDKLRKQGDSGTIKVEETVVSAEFSATPVIRGNSLYTLVEGPSWTQAEANAALRGGHLTSLSDANENNWLTTAFKDANQGYNTGIDSDIYWTGLHTVGSEWKWASGEPLVYDNFAWQWQFSDTLEGSVELVVETWESNPWGFTQGDWRPVPTYNTRYGIAEIPITLNIVRSGTSSEGGGAFTTTLNLFAGTTSTGNLAEGVTVYWKVTGITNDDLESGSDGLSGSGQIANGKLKLQHSLKQDADTGELFEVKVYSDADMTQQIGVALSTPVAELSKAIRGNSLYTFTNGPTWSQAESNSILLGGHLVTINNAEENNFLNNYLMLNQYSVYYGGSPIRSELKTREDLWIGIYYDNNQWKWSSGDESSYRNWKPGEPNASSYSYPNWGEINVGYDARANWEDGQGGWNDETTPWNQPLTGNFADRFQFGVAEIPLSLTITRNGLVKEGAGLFTTSINLSARSQTSGNLAEGAKVYWSISGITTDDLISGALTGDGSIINGKLDIQHSLKVDADTGEQFSVSVYSDASRTQQIGSTSSVAVDDSNSAPSNIILESTGILENSSVGVVVGVLSADDPDPGTSFTYELFAGDGSNDADNGLVEIINDEIRVKEDAIIDFETNPTLEINVQVTDNGSPALSLIQSVTAEVLDIADETPPELTSVTLKDDTVLLKFSEVLTVDQTPNSAFTVQTINPTTGTATNQTVTGVVQYASDKSQLILLVSGGITDLNFRVSYSDPAGNQTTGVVQDAAGNDAPSFVKDADTLILTGSSSGSLLGNSTSNTLIGNDGGNNLNGSTGSDSMSGGAGNDTYVVDNTGDTVTETSTGGTDSVQSSISYTLGSNVENLTLTGTATINGTGNTANNTLTGNSADNTLDGGTGADSMSGAAGNDTYVVDNTSDVVTEASSTGGTDTVQSSITYTLGTNIENLILSGTPAINGTGNTLNNSLTGNAAANTLNGGTGADSMAGAGGNDTYVVDNTGDVVTEDLGTTNGTDLVQSSVSYTISDVDVENLTLTGTGSINGTGNASANTIIGNSGANILVGSTGADVLTGGLGADTFRFALADSRLTEMDRITDFAIGTDKLDGPRAVSTTNTKELGTVRLLEQTEISAVLTSSDFGANQAATFTFGSGTSTRTFLALNDGTAGFSGTSDGLIEITGYTGNLTSLAIV